MHAVVVMADAQGRLVGLATHPAELVQDQVRARQNEPHGGHGSRRGGLATVTATEGDLDLGVVRDGPHRAGERTLQLLEVLLAVLGQGAQAKARLAADSGSSAPKQR